MFKEVHDINSGKCTIALWLVMVAYPNQYGCKIYFSNGQSIIVKETYEVISKWLKG